MFFRRYNPKILYEIEHLPLDNDESNIHDICEAVNVLFNPENISNLIKKNSWNAVSGKKNIKDEGDLIGYTKYLDQDYRRKNGFSELKSYKNLKKIDLKKNNILKRIITNHILFDGIENTHIDSIIELYNITAIKIIHMKKKILLLRQQEEKIKNINKSLLLISDLVNKLKEFRQHLVENILIRLEITAKYGLINDPVSHAINTYSKIQSDPIPDMSWDNNRLDIYFKFIMQSVVSGHKFRLNNINWGLGKLILRPDYSLMFYPNIFSLGELPMARTWFGFVFAGPSLIYDLFSNPLRFINIHRDIRSVLSIFESKDIIGKINKNDLNLIKGTITFLEKENDFIETEKSKLWSIFNPNVLTICERWQRTIFDNKKSILDKLFHVLINSIEKYDINSNNSAIETLLPYLQIITSSKTAVAPEVLGKFKTQFGGLIISETLNTLITRDLSARKSYHLINLLLKSKVLEKLFTNIELQPLIDLINISQNKSQYDFKQIKHLIAVLAKRYDINYLQAEYLTSDTIDSQSFIMQSILNSNHMKNNNKSYGMNLIDKSKFKVFIPSVNRHVAKISMLNSIIDGLENNDFDTLCNISNSITYKNSLKHEIYRYPEAYNIIQKKLSRLLTDNKEKMPSIDNLVIDFGSDSNKLAYILAQTKAKLLSGASYYEILKSDLIESIAFEEKSFRENIFANMHSLIVDIIESALSRGDFEIIDKILRDNSEYVRANIKVIQKRIDLLLERLQKERWSHVVNKIVIFFSSAKQKQTWLRNNLIRVLFSKDDDAGEYQMVSEYINSEISWQELGTDSFSSSRIKHVLSVTLDLVVLGEKQLSLLKDIFSNESFIDYHNLYSLRDYWVKKQNIWELNNVLDQHFANLYAKEGDRFESFKLIISSITNNQLIPRYYADKIIEVFWSDISEIIKSNILEGDLSKLNLYQEHIEKLIDNYSEGGTYHTKLRFLLWVLKKRSYISTAPSKICRLVTQGDRYSFINSMSLYLLHIGALDSNINADIKALFPRTSVGYLITFWKKQQQVSKFDDPFHTCESPVSSSDIQEEEKGSNGNYDIFQQIESEYLYIMDQSKNSSLSNADINMFKLFRNSLVSIGYSNDNIFKEKVFNLISKIDLSIGNSSAIKSISLNINATLFKSFNNQEEKECKQILATKLY